MWACGRGEVVRFLCGGADVRAVWGGVVVVLGTRSEMLPIGVLYYPTLTSLRVAGSTQPAPSFFVRRLYVMRPGATGSICLGAGHCYALSKGKASSSGYAIDEAFRLFKRCGPGVFVRAESYDRDAILLGPVVLRLTFRSLCGEWG